MAQSIKGVEIFATGTHNGSQRTTITEADLDAMVNSFNSLGGENGFKPVLKLGHDEAQSFIGQRKGLPNLGFVERIWREGSKILADFANVPEAIVELIRQRRYNTVSIEMFPKAEVGGNTFSNVLTAVALLGAELPAVKGLKELADFLFEEKEFDGECIALEYDVLYYADIGTAERKKLAQSGAALPDGSFPIRNVSDLRNAIQAFGRAKNKAEVARHIRKRARALNATNLLPTEGVLADKLKMEDDDMATYTQEQFDAIVDAAVAKAKDEAKAEFAEQVATANSERDAAVKAKDTAENALRTYEQDARTKEATAMVDAAIKEGKLTPAQKDEALAFALSLNGTVKFGDTEKSASDVFKSFIEKLPRQVDFDERGTGNDGENRQTATAAEEVDTKARKLLAEKKVETYAEARTLVLDGDPKLKQRYFEMED